LYRRGRALVPCGYSLPRQSDITVPWPLWAPWIKRSSGIFRQTVFLDLTLSAFDDLNCFICELFLLKRR